MRAQYRHAIAYIGHAPPPRQCQLWRRWHERPAIVLHAHPHADLTRAARSRLRFGGGHGDIRRIAVLDDIGQHLLQDTQHMQGALRL
ncbi:hypothetical protein D3C72_1711380 [compost metagenome]